MSKTTVKKKHGAAVQTTGHAWDGDLQEYNNPIPTWWVWSFYATCVFAVVYWILYPAWPIGTSYTKGLFNDISYEVNGQTKTSHWNTRALLLDDLQHGEESLKQKKYVQELIDSSYDEILSDPAKLDFLQAYGKTLFGDNCAACHGQGAAGLVGYFPNLIDDDWLWGGKIANIETTIRHGRQGYMPAFAQTFNAQQSEAVAEYVLSLSGHKGGDADKVLEGQRIFQGQEGGCYYCHTAKGTGLVSQGSANLTDSIWTIANVSAQSSYEDNREAVENVILHGVNRQMPAWQGRLSEAQIKLLTVYVKSLGSSSK